MSAAQMRAEPVEGAPSVKVLAEAGRSQRNGSGWRRKPSRGNVVRLGTKISWTSRPPATSRLQARPVLGWESASQSSPRHSLAIQRPERLSRIPQTLCDKVQGLQLLAAMPPLSITSVKTYGKTGIGCLVFQHKREDIPGTAAVIFDHQVPQAPLAHLAMTKTALQRFGNAG